MAFPLVRDLRTRFSYLDADGNDIYETMVFTGRFEIALPGGFAPNIFTWRDPLAGIRQTTYSRLLYTPDRFRHSAITDPDVFRLVRICDRYEITSPGSPRQVTLEIFPDGNTGDIEIIFRSDEMFLNYISNFTRSAFRMFVDLWKVELANWRHGDELWSYFVRAQTLPNQYQAMIRAACDVPITRITIKLTDLYQDPISTMNIIADEYFITNYNAAVPLGQNSILSIPSLIGLLGTQNPRDPRRMVPITSVTKVEIQYEVIAPVQGVKRPRSRSLGGGRSHRRRNRKH
jgi:hypothetical protein